MDMGAESSRRQQGGSRRGLRRQGLRRQAFISRAERIVSERECGCEFGSDGAIS